jgi:hypothetical protein
VAYTAGITRLSPAVTATGTESTLIDAGVSPMRVAFTVMLPGVSVDRTNTRFKPHSVSRYVLFVELAFPLLYPPRHTPGPLTVKSTRA